MTDIWTSTVCPDCGGKKSYGALRCWRCHFPSTPTVHHVSPDEMLRTRAMNCIRRGFNYHSMTDEQVIAKAQRKTDRDLLRLRNFGQRCLEWLRAQPRMDTPIPDPLEEIASETRAIERSLRHIREWTIQLEKERKSHASSDI